MSARAARLRQVASALLAFAVGGMCGSELGVQVSWGQSPLSATSNRTTVYEPGDVFLPGSRVYVSVGKTGFGHEHAIIGQLKSGRLRLDLTQQSGQLVFDLQSFTADNDIARKYIGLKGTTDSQTQRDVTANMQGSAVLDVARYPTATFQVLSIAPLSQSSARGLPQVQLTGDFTLHGTTQRIAIAADTEEANGWIHLRGGFTMRQTQYGITPFTKAFGAVGVSDQITVWGDVWLSKSRQEIAQSPVPR